MLRKYLLLAPGWERPVKQKAESYIPSIVYKPTNVADPELTSEERKPFEEGRHEACLQKRGNPEFERGIVDWIVIQQSYNSDPTLLPLYSFGQEEGQRHVPYKQTKKEGVLFSSGYL